MSNEKKFRNCQDKFGAKTNKLKKLISENSDWEDYVDIGSIEPIKLLIETGSFKAVESEYNINYQSLRGKIIRATKRIENKNRIGLRGAQSDKAKKLKELLMVIPDNELQRILSATEYKYAIKYLDVENFNEVARCFNAAPANVAKALYGDKTRQGALGKMEKNFYALMNIE